VPTQYIDKGNRQRRKNKRCSLKTVVGFHPEIVETNWFIKQKVNYIHNNPVVDKIVTLPEDYYFSSARNYVGLENELDLF
jgi:hypothetical protein